MGAAVSAPVSGKSPGHPALLGILGVSLVALNLRTAVVSLSPLYDFMRQSFAVSHSAQGIMGTLPVLCFAAFGIFGPRIGRAIGLERGMVLALLMIAAGEVLRAALSPSIGVFGLIDPAVVAECSEAVTGAMRGLAVTSLEPTELMQARSW